MERRKNARCEEDLTKALRVFFYCFSTNKKSRTRADWKLFDRLVPQLRKQQENATLSICKKLTFRVNNPQCLFLMTSVGYALSHSRLSCYGKRYVTCPTGGTTRKNGVSARPLEKWPTPWHFSTPLLFTSPKKVVNQHYLLQWICVRAMFWKIVENDVSSGCMVSFRMAIVLNIQR